ncbi:MAG TPA: TIGR01548 family HAD-type hydrolase [Rhodothermales bacterium]
MADPRTLKAVFFDMDGVLVDVSGSYRRAIVETAAHFIGRDVDPSLIQAYKNRGGFNDDWRLTHAIIRDHAVDVPFEDVVADFQRRYRGDAWDGFICQEPALIQTDVLERIRAGGRVAGVVTGRPDAEARWTLDRFGWTDLLPIVIAMEAQNGRGKPDPYPLELALELTAATGLAIDPREAAYVGDSVEDVLAARAAGMGSIGVVPPYLDASHGDVLREKGAHVVVTDFSALPDIIDRFFELAD